MACFLVAAAEAAAVTIATKVIEKKENSEGMAAVKYAGSEAKPEELKAVKNAAGTIDMKAMESARDASVKTPFSRKLKWLSNMLWGGSALLAFEHLWHGEIVPWFPFLTAAGDPASASEMLYEMATVGVAMSVLVTLVWVGMLGVSSLIEKKALGRKCALAGEGATIGESTLIEESGLTEKSENAQAEE